MDTPFASNIINLFVAIGTIGAVIVALVGIWLNRRQTRDDWLHAQQLAREDWLHAQQLAIDERHHQSRPIVVPVGEFESNLRFLSMENNSYKEDGLINWAYSESIQLALQNMGGGVALNVHCVLYGPEPIHISQFVSWNNGPIGKKSIQIKCEHPKKVFLSPNDSINENYPLYDTLPPNSIEYPIARLTITYQDLFDNKYVSIFNHMLDHRWVNVKIDKIPSLKNQLPLDLKELNNQKRQQTPKFSAPVPKKSQGN